MPLLLSSELKLELCMPVGFVPDVVEEVVMPFASAKEVLNADGLRTFVAGMIV